MKPFGNKSHRLLIAGLGLATRTNLKTALDLHQHQKQNSNIFSFHSQGQAPLQPQSHRVNCLRDVRYQGGHVTNVASELATSRAKLDDIGTREVTYGDRSTFLSKPHAKSVRAIATAPYLTPTECKVPLPKSQLHFSTSRCQAIPTCRLHENVTRRL
jgi:hypothetical protein